MMDARVKAHTRSVMMENLSGQSGVPYTIFCCSLIISCAFITAGETQWGNSVYVTRGEVVWKVARGRRAGMRLVTAM